MNISKRLTELRLLHGLSQVQVARKIKLSPSTYSRFEKNTQSPPLYALERLMELYKVDPNTLLGIDSHSKEYLKLVAKFTNPKTKEQLDKSIRDHILNIAPLLEELDKKNGT